MRPSRPRFLLWSALALILAACLRAAQPSPGEVPAAAVGPGTRVEQVIVTFKTHFDIGYTDLASNVVQRYRTAMIDQALRVCDDSQSLPPAQRFVWMIPGWPMQQIVADWPGQVPARQRRVLEHLRTRRFALHALPFTTHTELLEAEDLVRGLGYASRLSRRVGLELPRDAKMTDVPCHAWILPTLLRRAGVDFLHLGCNAASRSPEVPTLFWWEGPDGSRLLTMYTAESYGTGLVPPAAWPHKTWLALVHTGDNHGPPTPEEVRQLWAEAPRKLPGVRVRIGRLSDFADAILAERPDLPVVRGDMPDTWIHGPMCDPAGAKLARNLRPQLAACEALQTQLRAWGVSLPDLAPRLAAAYDQSLLYGEHTWGGALYWIQDYGAGQRYPYDDDWKRDRAAGRFARLEASWAEHTAYIESAERIIRPLLAGQLEALARAVAVPGERILVYNPLPWPRDGWVTVRSRQNGIRAVQPVDGGPALPAREDDAGLHFLAQAVPAMGYRTYVPGQAELAMPAEPVEADTLENRWLKVRMDPARGVVRSLVEKQSGRELLDDNAPHGLGQYLYERFDASQVQGFVRAYVKIAAAWATNELGKPNLPPAERVPYRASSPQPFTVRYERTPVSQAAVMAAAAGPGISHPVITRVTLPARQPYLDLEVTLQDKPADPWPEAGWICLPFRVDEPRFRLGRLGSIVDPARDIVPGSNQRLLGLQSGLTITDAGGQGVGLCPIDHPLVSLERPGCWEYTRDFRPTHARVYVNLFNNQWTTNFRLWNEGTWTSRVRVWAVDRPDPATSLITPAAEARQPLLATPADGPAGGLPPTQAGLELARRGTVVTAFGADPDGSGLLLRLWEQAGSAGPCPVRLPSGLAAKLAQPVDLRGQPRGVSVPIREGQFAFELDAFAPASFRLVE